MLRETTRRETRAVIQKPEASISRSAPSLLPSTAAHVPERESIPQSSRPATKVHDYAAPQVCTVSILSLPWVACLATAKVLILVKLVHFAS